MSKLVTDYVKDRHFNYVVDLENLSPPPVVKHMIKDDRVLSNTQKELSSIDSRYVLLYKGSPYELKGRLQLIYGENIVLGDLYKNHRTLYNKVIKEGKPQEVLAAMGFNVEIRSNRLTERQLKVRLHSLAKSKKGLVGIDRRSPSTYRAIRRNAKEAGISVDEYIKGLGFAYKVKST